METLSAKGETIQFPSNEELLKTYSEIERAAVFDIRNVNVAENPF